MYPLRPDAICYDGAMQAEEISYRATGQWPYQVSSGGAVVREVEGGRQYALLYRGERFGVRGNSWHLPKGTLEAGETLEQAALREIREETGLTVELVAYLGALHGAWYSQEKQREIDRISHYFLCRVKEGTSAGPLSPEHDRLVWQSAAEAVAALRAQPKQESQIIERAERWFRLGANPAAQ
jgi:8-oxo-dGTP pyrophosphatase MutT (NUDIX family)